MALSSLYTLLQEKTFYPANSTYHRDYSETSGRCFTEGSQIFVPFRHQKKALCPSVTRKKRNGGKASVRRFRHSQPKNLPPNPT